MNDPRCESPIEKMMLDALLRNFERYYISVAIPHAFTGIDDLPIGVWIIPQAEIGRYRVDFLAVLKSGGWIQEHKDIERKSCVMVAVECDGHEWHERTPEQAQRDKARDRVLQRAGMQVLRFTGREIWHQTDACALEVVSSLDAAIIARMEAAAA